MNKGEAGKLGSKKSQITQQIQKQKRIAIYNSNPVICKNCGNPLPYSGRHKQFCNSSCAAIYNNNKNRPTSQKDSSYCLFCGKLLKRVK